MGEGSILIVAPLSGDRQLLESLLHGEGYKMHTAGSGEEALRTVALEHPELILLDIMLPGVGGIETCRKLKANPETAWIPVIFIGEKEEVWGMGLVFEAGGADYLSKPFDVQEVLARLRPHLELAQTRRALEERTAALRASEERYQRLVDGIGDNHPMFSRSARGESRCANDGIAGKITGHIGGERGFRSLAENLPSPVFRYDRDCRRLYVNPAAERVSGMPAEQLLGVTPSDSSNLTRESAARMVEAIRAVFATGELHEGDVDYLLPGGGRSDYHGLLVPEFDAEGQVTTVLAIGHEVTGLREAERRAARFFANMPGFAFSFLMPEEGAPRFPFASPGIERIYGLRPEDVREDMAPLHALAHPDDRPRIEAVMAEATRTLVPSQVEFRIRRPDGQERWIESRSVPERQADGSVLWHGIMLDISERKAAQQRMELLDLAIDGSSDAVFLTDQKGHFHYVNATACSDLGYTREELLGMTPLDINPDVTPEALQDIMQTTLAGEYQVIEARHQTRDGHIFPVEISASPVEFEGELFSLVTARDITGRKRMEAALAKSERDFRSLAENSPDNIARWDAAGRILYCNPTHLRTLGKTADELLGKTVGEVFPDGRSAVFDEAFAHTVATGEAMTITRAAINGEHGETRLHDIKLVPEFDADGTVASVLGIGHDMTDIYRMQEAIATREQEFRSLAENSPDNIARWDTAGRTLYSNPTHLRTVGKTADELIGKTHDELFPDMRLAAFDEAFARVIDTGELTMITRVAIPGENGETYFHDITLVPEFDTDGQVMSVLGIGRDMTEVYNMQEALAAREAEYRALAENSPDPIIRYDLSGRRLYANAMAYSMTSLPHDKLVGGLPQRTERLSQADVEKVRRCLEATAQTGQPSGCEVDFHMPDGSNRVYQNSYVPELGADGKVASILGVSRDITAVRETERQLRHLTDNLPGYVYTASLAPDGQMSVPYVSAACEDIYGLRPEEVEDDPGAIHALVHPDDLQRIEAAIGESARNLMPFRIEYRIRRPGHAERWLEARSQPMRRADGTIVWHGMVLDITERRHSQDALAAREQEFRSLAESSPDFIIRYDLEHRILYLNAGLARELKLGSAEEVIGRRPIEVWPDGRFSVIDEAARRVIAGGEAETIEMPYERRTGGIANGQIVVVPEHNVDGAIIGTLAFGRDITPIREGERRLRHVIDNLPGLAYTFRVTPDGRMSFPYMTPAIEEIYGLRPEDVKDDATPLHMMAHPDDRPRIEAAIDKSARNLSLFRIEYRVCRPGHPERWIEARSAPERAPDDAVLWHGIMLDITERKHSQDALAIREQEFRSLAESSPDGIIRYDLEQRILYMNERLARDLHLDSVDEVIGRRPIEAWPDGRFSAIEEAARRVTASGVEESIEMVIGNTRGRNSTGLIVVVPERDVDGAIIGTLAFGRDITELKRAGEMLAEAQTIARLGSWDWDVVADRVAWSEMAYEIYTPDARPTDPGYEDFKRAVHPDDLERVDTAVTAAFEHDAPFDLDHRVISKSRGVRTVHAQAKVFRAADGTPVRMVGTVQDITERKKAQQRMELLERAVDHSSDAIWLVAPDLSIRYVNDTACRMLGYSREELLRLTSPDIDADITREDAANMVDIALAGEPIRFESRHRAKDGRIFPVEISGTLIEDRGEYFSLVGIRDITERKRAEEAARERLEEVSRLQRLQTADELATVLAHELNQPLTAIAIYTVAVQRLLDAQGTPPDMGRIGETLQRVKKQALRAGESIRQLRAFVGRGKLKPQPIDLNGVLREACELILPQMKAKDIQLKTELDASQPRVMGVEVHIEQVLLNLLRNAIEAIEEAGMPSGTVIVRSHQAQDFALVSVCDTGPGISAEVADTLFGSLESNKSDGLGVGLRISRGLVEAQEGGRLWVEPQTPGGVFHFVLPLA